MKSLYYCRSLSIQRADTVSEKAVGPISILSIENDLAPPPGAARAPATNVTNYEECLACQ